jgi:hypothetical protein
MHYRGVSKLSQPLARIATVITATGMALILVELLLHLFVTPPALLQEWVLSEFYRHYRVFDNDTLFTRPQYLDKDYFASADEDLTIIALGDSFTEGSFWQKDFNYPTYLRGMLEDAGVDATVINAGLIYSGNDQHLALLKHKILPVSKPDIVIYQFCFNDFWDNIDLSLYRIENNKLVHHGIDHHWLYTQHQLLDYIPLPYRIKKDLFIVRLLIATLNQERRYYLPEAYKHRAILYSYRKTAIFIDEMTALSKQHGFDLYFTMVDLQAEHLKREGRPYNSSVEMMHHLKHYNLQRELIAHLDNYIETHFEPADLTAVNHHFKTDTLSVGTDLFTNAGDPSEWGERHYNRYGYWLFARKIRDDLLEKRLLDVQDNLNEF